MVLRSFGNLLNHWTSSLLPEDGGSMASEALVYY
jgi:hypothetical protein